MYTFVASLVFDDCLDDKVSLVHVLKLLASGCLWNTPRPKGSRPQGYIYGASSIRPTPFSLPCTRRGIEFPRHVHVCLARRSVRMLTTSDDYDDLS
jgi:hypothetical protein